MSPDSTRRLGWKRIWLDPCIPFSRNVPLHILIAAFALYWGFMAWSPTNRGQWFAENVLLAAALLTLAFTYKRFRFSNLSYFLVFLFMCLHTYAAHYTYSGTPFDTWLKSKLHTERSCYDRIVHFSFGLLWVYPFRELLTRAAHLRSIWSYVIPAAVITCLSALFEILEMLAAVIAGPGGEEKFIGMQGDIFDTQKDMMVSVIGSLIATGVIALVWRIRRKSRPVEAGSV